MAERRFEWQLSRPAVVAVGVTVAVECLVLGGHMSNGFSIGSQLVPWAAVPGLVAAALLPRFHGVSSWRTMIPSAVLASFVVAALINFPADAEVSLVLVAGTALVNELVFRLAVPLSVVVLFRRFGVGGRAAIFLACCMAAPLFALLPDHVIDYGGPVTPTVYLNIALFTSYAVWRGCTLWPAVAAHFCFDVLTMEANAGIITAAGRSIAIGAVLASMVLIAGERARAAAATATEAEPDDEHVIIDLRDAPVVVTSTTESRQVLSSS